MIFVLFADDAIFYFCDLQCRTESWTLLFLAHMRMYIFFFFFHRRSRHAGVLRFTSGPRDKASTTRTRLSPSWTRSPTLAAISRHCYLFSRCAWSFVWCFSCAFAKLSDGPENSEYSEKRKFYPSVQVLILVVLEVRRFQSTAQRRTRVTTWRGVKRMLHVH